MTTNIRKNVLITGAAGGIGRGLCQAFAARGYDVLALGRNEAALNEVANEIGGGRVRPVVADLSAETVRLPELVTSMPRLDVLVLNAAISLRTPFAQTTDEQWDDVFRVNLLSAAKMCRTLLPALRAARGHVVFINMIDGLHAVPNWATYMATKAGLSEIANSLRTEEAANGIAVTSIHPGGTDTPMLKAGLAKRGMPYEPERYIQPRDLAQMVCDCVSPANTAYATRISIARRP